MDIVEIIKAVVFGVVQGVTEWLPISSTGHMILLDEFLQLAGDEAVIAVGAVVGADVQVGAGLPHLLLQDHDVLGAEADDDVDVSAHLVQGFGLRVSDGTAHAAADDCGLLDAVQIGGGPQRAHKVQDAVPGIHAAQQIGGKPHFLKNYGNRSAG